MVSVDEFGLYTEVFPVLNSGVFGTLYVCAVMEQFDFFCRKLCLPLMPLPSE